uniref:(northern house mosquito) hypothetical protein n=1 Tax=Culex pipiens TaxID=7175 RepID=A0A8D8ERX9_CULPI
MVEKRRQNQKKTKEISNLQITTYSVVPPNPSLTAALPPPSWLAYISTQHRRDRVLSLTTSLVFPLNLFRVPLGVWTAVPTPSAASTPFPVALLSVEMADFSPLPWAK